MKDFDKRTQTREMSDDAVRKEMRALFSEVMPGKFHPYLDYCKETGLFQVILRDCSMCEGVVTTYFDVLIDNHPRKRQGSFVGFHLWGVRGMLKEQGYKKSSISLEHLIKRFGRYHKLPHGRNVFGKYEEKILKIARKNQFVWYIPK